MIVKSHEDIKKARLTLFKQAEKVTSIKKGNRRTHYLRKCVVCGKPLSKYVFNTNNYIVTVSHKMCYLDDRDFIKLAVCSDIKSCYSYCDRKERSGNGIIGPD